MKPETREAFIARTTEIMTSPLVPELRLHLAADARDIFQQALDFDPSSHRPYWAFAWPGGQALARTILDRPGLVAGRRVLDLGAGSGMAAIAAMRAGAVEAIAADTDPLAVTAARLNAQLSGVTLATTTDDLLATASRFDLVIVGDLVYEPELKDRVGGFIATNAARGAGILYGDRTTARRPPGNFRLLAEFAAPLMPALDDEAAERARVWTIGNPGFQRPRAAPASAQAGGGVEG